MNATTEAALGRLHDEALEALLLRGVARPSVEVELDLWRALLAAFGPAA